MPPRKVVGNPEYVEILEVSLSVLRAAGAPRARSINKRS